MYGTGINVKTEADISDIIRQYLSEEQIEENYQRASNKYFANAAYDNNAMGRVVKECREMALSQLPAGVFTVFQIMYIRKEWGIDI